MIYYGHSFGPLIFMASSQLSAPEFLNREMEACETENHLLWGWCTKLLYKKITFPL